LDIPNKPVDIIIPVYAGVTETLTCIESVLESLPQCQIRAEVVVIFDAGPDLSLRNALLELASREQISLLINEQNQGFVCCINKGISRSSKDVVLLNSDTIVAGDWLDRLVGRAYQSSHIATATPFSNNAEICSFPQLCEVNSIFDDLPVSEIDNAFSILDAPSISIPTAVGFCMFIKRDCISRIGLFDIEKFGRGYGEENDFCMRAAKLNYTHILASNVYVHHHGGVSFGEEKSARVQQAMLTLDQMYPRYHALVAKHIAEDPARKWRFAAELLLKARRELPLVLHISHGIGGGTDKHVVQLAQHCSDTMQHAMLVPQANSARLVFPNVVSGGLFEFPYSELQSLKNLLFSLSLNRVHLHHIKGWETRIAKLLDLLNVPYDITLHDYYFLHPNPALADKRGVFCEEAKGRDEVCAEFIAFPRGVDGPSWREQWSGILNKAERIFAPSNSAAAIYNQYHSKLSITCAFHPDHEASHPYPDVSLSPVKTGEPMRVAVLGALSIIKGANVLERVAYMADRAGILLEFTLIGYAYKKLATCVHTTGTYRDEELPALLESVDPHVIWFPCTWPETYSYTLSSALDKGLPVIGPDLGAFPERLQNRPFTWVEPWQTTPQAWLDRLLEIREEMSVEPAVLPWQQQPCTSFSYSEEYPHTAIAPDMAFTSADKLMAFWLEELPQASGVNRRFYRALIWLNSHRWFGHVANLIPHWLRRTVKRKLSTRPLHD